MWQTILLVPDSLRNDPQVQSACASIDKELEAIYADIPDVCFWPNLYQQVPPLLDVMMWEYHVDVVQMVVDGSPLTDEKKRELIDKSIEWHQHKGTKWVVEQVLQTVWTTAYVVENWEYGGRPYYFKIRTTQNVAADPELFRRVWEIVMEVKNVRSWLEGFIRPQESREEIFVGCATVVRKHTRIPSYDVPGKRSAEIAYAGGITLRRKISKIPSYGDRISRTVLLQVIPSISAPDSIVSLDIIGANFNLTSVIYFDDVPIGTTFVNSAHLTSATFDVGSIGNKPVRIRTDNMDSNTLVFVVTATPDPILVNLKPFTAMENELVTFAVQGHHFQPTSVIEFDGTEVATTFVDANNLTADLPIDVGVKGAKDVVIVTGALRSNTVVFSVSALHTITQLIPDTQLENTTCKLKVWGTDFQGSAKIVFDGVPQPTMWITSTEIETVVAFNVGAARDVDVTVTDARQPAVLLSRDAKRTNRK